MTLPWSLFLPAADNNGLRCYGFYVAMDKSVAVGDGVERRVENVEYPGLVVFNQSPNGLLLFYR